MTSRHWGEIPNCTPELLPDVTRDIDKAMDKFCLSEFDFSEEVKPTTLLPIVLQPSDSLVMYAISLHKYITHMTEITRVAQLAIDGNIMPCKEAAPPIPPIPEITLKHQPNFLNFIPKEDTDFTLGKEIEVPVLSDQIVNKILRRSICTLLGHIGYETTNESLLNILIDVLKQFYKQLISKLQTALHDEEKYGSSGFPHVIERVLVDIGMGGVKGIHDYYQSRVIKYINVLHARATELSKFYDNLLILKQTSSANDNGRMHSDGLKKEEIEENPEVHLLDGEIEFPSLESGYQLLNSLEAETNLQNFVEGDEEMLATEYPGNVIIEAEFSPFAKRKKSTN